MTEKLLLTVPEVAEAIGLGRSKTYELVASGEIESCVIGKCRRVPREALEHYVESLRADAHEADAASPHAAANPSVS